MIHRIGIIVIIFTGLLLIPAVLATENKVPRDGTVYVGEADLDLSDCNLRSGDEIAWWESGNPQGTPTARGRVDDVRRFTVEPETFRGHTGAWYGLIGKKLVFHVEEPFLQFDINENGIDTEPDSIKRGNLVSFKISTNLAALSKRAGSSGAEVIINMTGPNETVYHTLTSTRTNDFNLDKVYVYTSPFDTGAVWDTTDAKKFPDGEYTFSASTNVNRISEINPEIGATSTEKRTYRLGKTEVKPTTKETEKPEKSRDKKKNLSDNSTNTSTLLDNQDKDSSDEKTGKEDNSDEKINTTVSATSTKTPEETETPTPEMTLDPTIPPTEEPTPEITPHATRTPFPRPPGPGASPTKASPVPLGIILTALVGGTALIIIQRRK